MSNVNCRIVREVEAIDEGDGTTRLAYEVADADIPKNATLANMQGIVGGNVDCIDIVHPDTGAIATMWFHDDGKAVHERNLVADFIAEVGGWQGKTWGDWIAGPVVLTGFNPASGETVTLPQEWGILIDAIRGAE